MEYLDLLRSSLFSLNQVCPTPLMANLYRRCNVMDRGWTTIKNKSTLRDFELRDFFNAKSSLTDWLFDWKETIDNNVATPVTRNIQLADGIEQREIERLTALFTNVYTNVERSHKKDSADFASYVSSLLLTKQKNKKQGNNVPPEDTDNNDNSNNMIIDEFVDDGQDSVRTFDENDDVLSISNSDCLLVVTGDNEYSTKAASLQPLPPKRKVSAMVLQAEHPMKKSNSKLSSSKDLKNNSIPMDKEHISIDALHNSTNLSSSCSTGSLASLTLQKHWMSTIDDDLDKLHEDEEANVSVVSIHMQQAALVAIETSLDHLLLHLSVLVLLLVFAELKKNTTTFSHYMLTAQQIASEFTCHCLARIEMLCVDDQDMFQNNLLNKSLKMIPGRGHRRSILRQIILKLRILDQVFSALDIMVLPKTWSTNSNGMKSLCLSNLESSIVLTAGFDGLIRIVDFKPQRPQCLAQFSGHGSIVTCCRFTKRDQYIVSSSFDHTIRIWNSQNATTIRTLVGHSDAVLYCDVSPDSRHVVSCSMDNTVRYWDINSGVCQRVFTGHTNWVKVCRFSPDGDCVISAGLDKCIFVWSLEMILGTEKPDLRPKLVMEHVHEDYILDIDIYKPTLLLTTSRDHAVKLIDWEIGTILYTIPSVGSNWACSVAFSNCGQLFATGSFDSFLVIYSTKTGKRLREFKVNNHGILTIQWCLRRDQILLGTSEGSVQIVYL